MKFYFLLILFGFNIINSQTTMKDIKLIDGTTVIAFLKDDIGWIVADTKVNLIINGINTGTENVTKIKQTSDIYYAFTVHPIVHFNNELIYDAFSVIDSIIKREIDFDRSFESFDEMIINKLDELINILLKQNQIITLEKYTKTSFLGFLMVQYENDKPKYQIRSYKFQKINKKFKTVIDPPFVMKGQNQILFLGSYKNAVRYIASNPSIFVGFRNIKEKLICLVTKEIETNPDHVGYPIDAVEITKDGGKWDYKITECSIKD